MFVKITTSGPRQYVKLVEAFRDTGGISRQRVIATLGRLETIRAGDADSLVNGLLRASGKPTLEQGTGAVDFAPARSPSATPGCSPLCGRNLALRMRFAGYCATAASSMPNACCV